MLNQFQRAQLPMDCIICAASHRARLLMPLHDLLVPLEFARPCHSASAENLSLGNSRAPAIRCVDFPLVLSSASDLFALLVVVIAFFLTNGCCSKGA